MVAIKKDLRIANMTIREQQLQCDILKVKSEKLEDLVREHQKKQDQQKIEYIMVHNELIKTQK